MPSICSWGRTEKSATHQKMYACLTYKVSLSAAYIEHTPYGPEDMANRQPSDCQSTMNTWMINQCPTYRTSEVGWTSNIPRGRDQSADTRRSTYKLYENMISKSITHSFRHNAMPSADQGYWNTMTSTILPTTRQRSTRIVQLTTNLSVRVANWQSQIPSSSVTRTWCRAPTHPQAATTRCQVFYLRDMSVPPVSKLITNVP